MSTQTDLRSIERRVGQRIGERRTMLGLTQQQLAELIGVTYQQAHKYERGINRISAGRLFQIARVLGVEMNYFFDKTDANDTVALTDRQRMCLDIARNFARIHNDRSREALSLLCRVMADEEPAN